MVQHARRLGSKYSSPASSESEQMVKCLKRLRLVDEISPQETSMDLSFESPRALSPEISKFAKKKEQMLRLLDEQMRRYKGDFASRCSSKFSPCE
jgi:hypothetical protein